MDLLAQMSVVDQQHMLAANYEKTLLLLRALKAGTAQLAAVTLTDSGWSYTTQPAVPTATLADAAQPTAPASR